MENFIEKLRSVQTLEENIGKIELKRLAKDLIQEYECEKELENNLLLFFSLNSSDVESLLKRMRKDSIKAHKKDKLGKAFLRNNERLISGMVENLNKLSLEETKKPFHLSAALGELKVTEKMANSFELNAKDLLTNDTDETVLKAAGCPYGSYPRYVGKQWPWKLKMSFRTRTYQRKEDVGCHFQHGPFNGVIRGWVSFSPQVLLMVLLQGWGFKLAANNNHFFYKWWFVIAVGLSPWSCQWLLFARKY